MASARQQAEYVAKGLCRSCGAKRAPGRAKCEPCLARHREYLRVAYRKHTTRAKGDNVEPQCQPSKGAMRAEHEWDDEIGACVRCGEKRPTGFMPTAAAEDPAPVHTAADVITRSAGPRGTRAPLTREQKLRFHGGMMAPVPAPAGAPQAAPSISAPQVRSKNYTSAPEDLATIPDPIAATIAELQLWRAELDVTIATLERYAERARKSA
jgi:hypothetical protein